MAKKKLSPSELPVEDKLKLLYQLQTVLSEIDRIRTLRGELPLEVEDLEDEVEGLKTRIERTQESISALRASVNELKNNISIAQGKIETYKQQLDNVRNNREYDTLNKEIEFKTLEVELFNKRIREAQIAERAKEEVLESSKHTLEERMQDLEVTKNELDEIVAETKADEEKLREKAKNLELSIEPRLLTSFKRIRKSTRNGLGIVYVQRDSCGGCFAQIPPQRQLDVRMRKKIIVCEYCGRILIDPELAGVKIEKPAEEPKRRVRRASRKASAESADNDIEA
ncbi:MAG: hypothetical protein IJ557_07835 [Bacteroidaceae bacterium]|nr:hypothetical protein [Bacteroidaceae bacterium]MBR1379015.1 hypothetical protein [Bacteroidaceae bacterium]